jgi:hypothetical protein
LAPQQVLRCSPVLCGSAAGATTAEARHLPLGKHDQTGDRIMKYQRTILLLALITALTACNIPQTTISNGKDGKITLQDDVVTLHVDGSPDATINMSGDLTIDNKSVSTTSSQRGLLMLYAQSMKAVHDQAMDLGTTSAKIGLAAAKNKISGQDDEAANKQLDDQAKKQASQYVVKMCQDQADIKAVQDQLAAQFAAFKPYGGIISDKSLADCRKDADD